MRGSIRHVGVLVACLSVGAVAVAATASPPDAKAGKVGKPGKVGKKGKSSPAQKEADAFLATVTGLVWPVSTSASLADWAAATDVTPEHVAQRTGADKALAAVSGSTTVIDKTKALLKNEKQLDELTVRQLRKLLLTAAESPGTIPEVVAKRVELEVQAVGASWTATRSACSPRATPAPSRSPPTTSTTS